MPSGVQMSTDDAFEPYWLDETDWLVTLCVMLEDEDDLIELNWIGRPSCAVVASS